MKRFWWLLAVPYVVTVSTPVDKYRIDGSTGTEYKLLVTPDKFGFGYICNEEAKDFCLDLAQALNDAHERRDTVRFATQTWTGDPNRRFPSTTTWGDPPKRKIGFDTDAWEEGGCGKEP